MNCKIYEFDMWDRSIPGNWIQYVFIQNKQIILKIDFENNIANDMRFDYGDIEKSKYWKRIV